MENVLYYALVKKVMPRVVHDVLFNKKHMVININAFSATNDAHFHLDEAQEALIIGDTKRMCVNNEKVLSSIAPWIMLVGVALTSLCFALGIFRPVKRSEADLDSSDSVRNKSSYDREKRTAKNIKFMLDYCPERSWLSESHISSPHMMNVLTVPSRVITDDVDASKLIMAKFYGLQAARMHLSKKLWELFGDLTEEEASICFEVSNPRQMRMHFTNGFKFKSMADLLNISREQNASKYLRPKRDVVKSKMMARIRDMGIVTGKLTDIMCKCAQGTPKFIALASLREQLRAVEHILVPHNYAYRNNLSSDCPYREPCTSKAGRLSFLYQLQASVLGSIGVNQEDLFKTDRARAMENVNSIHVNVTPYVIYQPLAQMGSKTIEECVMDKMYRKALDILGSERLTYEQLLEVHIHCDDLSSMPLPTLLGTKTEKASDSSDFAGTHGQEEVFNDGPSRLSNQQEQEPILNQSMDTSHAQSCEPTTVYRDSWRSLLRDPHNYQYLKSLHAILFAKGLIILFANHSQDVRIFIHGVPPIISSKAYGLPLGELSI